MKKLIFFFALLLLMVSCSKSEAKLEAIATIANSSCPMAVDEATTLTDVEYSVGTMFYNYTVDEERVPLEALDAGLEQLSDNIKASLELPQSKELVDACKEAHAKIHYAYSGKQSKRSLGITVDPTTGNTTFSHLNN